MAIVHNADAFDLMFVLNRLVRMNAGAPLHERKADHVSEGAEYHVVGQKLAGGIRFDGREIVVSKSL